MEESKCAGFALRNQNEKMGAEWSTYVPNDERVVVLAAERREILLVEAERQRLDEHLVQLQAVDHLQGIEVPDDDVGLQ